MPSTTLNQLMSDLSTLKDKYQTVFEPEYNNAKVILQSMLSALEDSSDVFEKVTELYRKHLEFQSMVQG